MPSAIDYQSTLLSQQIFRETMNAFAHPMKCHDISGCIGDGPDAAILALCSVFLDNTAAFFAYGAGDLAKTIEQLTYARPSELAKADFAIIQGSGFSEWGSIYTGTLLDPHKGATVIIEAPKLEGDAQITASGPGINGEAQFYVDRQIADCLQETAKLEIEYPMGFELIFITKQGKLIALPRRVSAKGEGM
ncbi:MAG: phosphonate C-P lyase system protein PhnH [Eubacteriaceae bacterium]|nr:phosphonate C-P lyase system protein PhnH [Eubacteriaceae bacterium]